MEQNASKKRLWNSVYLMLNLVNILTNLGFSMVTTTISVYSVELGASLSLAGTVASIFSFTALLIRPFSGFFVDKYDKKKIFVISTFLFGAVVYGFAFSKSIPMLFVFRILQGLLFGITTTCSMAMVSRAVPKNRVSEGLGYFNAGIMIGQAVGPTIAVALKDSIGFSWMYIIVATSICLPPLLCLLMKFPAEATKPSTAVGSDKKFHFSFNDFIAKKFILYALVCGMFSFYNGIANSFMLFIGEERAILNISLFFTVSSAVLLLVRILAGKTSDRGSLTVLVNCALVCTAISMFTVGVAKSLGLMIFAAVLKAFGQGVGHVSLQGEALKKADPEHVGAASSTMYIGNDIGNTLGPIIGGVISQNMGYASVFNVSIILTAVAFVAFNIYQKKIGYTKPVIAEEKD